MEGDGNVRRRRFPHNATTRRHCLSRFGLPLVYHMLFIPYTMSLGVLKYWQDSSAGRTKQQNGVSP